MLTEHCLETNCLTLDDLRWFGDALPGAAQRIATALGIAPAELKPLVAAGKVDLADVPHEVRMAGSRKIIEEAGALADAASIHARASGLVEDA